MTQNEERKLDGPSELVAIAYACHRCGDRRMERSAKRILRDRFGITIRFEKRLQPEGGNHAS